MEVLDFVYYEHMDDEYVIKHEHPTFECLYFLEGEVSISTDRAVYQLKSPCLAIIPPKLIHDEKELTKTKLYIVMYECDDIMDNSIKVISLNDEQHSSLKERFDSNYHLFLDSKINELNDEFVKTKKLFENTLFIGRDTEDRKRFIKQAKAYIRENFADDIDYVSYANNCGYSYSRFRHMFVDEVGMPPHRYCLNVKLAKAKDLLTDTNLKIQEIAKICGFDSIAIFDIFFQKEMNVSPSTFRKQTRESGYGAVISLQEKEKGNYES